MTEITAALLAPIATSSMAALLVAAAATAGLLVAVARREAPRVGPPRGRVIALRAVSPTAARPVEAERQTRRAS